MILKLPLAKFAYISVIVCYLLPWQLGIWFCKVVNFKNVEQELNYKYDAIA